MSTKTTYDFIIIGGGTAGCVVASRLLQRQPSLLVLLIEAGADVTHRAHISKPLESAHLHGSEMDWNYMTVPQRHLDGRPRYNCAAKALSGGVAINAGTHPGFLIYSPKYCSSYMRSDYARRLDSR